jgi:hypothetical protein
VKKGSSRQGHLWIFSFVESSGQWAVISGQFTTEKFRHLPEFASRLLAGSLSKFLRSLPQE